MIEPKWLAQKSAKRTNAWRECVVPGLWPLRALALKGPSWAHSSWTSTHTLCVHVLAQGCSIGKGLPAALDRADVLLLTVRVHVQQLMDDGWGETVRDQALARQIENLILARARELRAETLSEIAD